MSEHGRTGEQGGEMRERGSWVLDGLVAGLIGYFTVAVLFALSNVLGGESLFHTPAVLGSALFFGSGSTAAPAPGPGPIIAYNGLHLAVSLLIGLLAGWLLFQTERQPVLWYPVLFVFLAGFVYSVVAVGVLASELAHLLSWATIVLANLLAGLTAGGYLWSRHRTLMTRVNRPAD